MTNICILQGHPNSGGNHLCHGLADAYRNGAQDAGHSVTTLDLGALTIELLRDPAKMLKPPHQEILDAQSAMLAAEHLMMIYPLWLGTMPALVKAFFEQAACGEFLIAKSEHGWPIGKLKGRSARLVVTMGMPSAIYRLAMGAHGVRGFESGILGMAGIGPIRETLLGGVDGKPERRAKWIAKMTDLGARAH